MVMLTLGYDNREKYNWIIISNDYSKTHYNRKLVVRIHAKLWEKVKNIMKYQKKGYDTLLLIDGARRTGKSTLGKTIAYLINPNGTINNFVAGLEEAPDKIDKAKEEDYLFFDEGSLVASSKDGMTKLNKQLEKIIDVIGIKKLVLIFCMPTFFGISRAISVDHSRFLLHVYTGKKLERGKFAYFSTKKKKLLYIIGKKNFGSYAKPRRSWLGKFDDFKLPFEDDYEKLKAQSLKEALGTNKESKKNKKPKTRSDYLTEFIGKFKDNCPEIKAELIWKGFGTSKTEYYRRKKVYASSSYPLVPRTYII